MSGSLPLGMYRLRSPDVFVGAAATDRERGQEVESDQAHAGDGDRGPGGSGMSKYSTG